MPVIVEQSYDCTPSSLMASVPCIQCISEKEMLAVIVGIIALATDQTVPTVMKSSACFACLSKKQILQGLTTIMGSQLLGAGQVPAVIKNIKCLECASEKALLAAILYQFCNNLTITTR